MLIKASQLNSLYFCSLSYIFFFSLSLRCCIETIHRVEVKKSRAISTTCPLPSFDFYRRFMRGQIQEIIFNLRSHKYKITCGIIGGRIRSSFEDLWKKSQANKMIIILLFVYDFFKSFRGHNLTSPSLKTHNNRSHFLRFD